MPVELSTRERLRQGLLGPLGEEVTGLLMQELDQAGLRAHIDQRFEQIDRRFEKIDQRFEKIDERFERIDERFVEISQQFVEVHAAIKDIGRETKLMVFSICGAFAVIVVASLMETIRG